MAELRGRDLARCFVRSLALQGSWSFAGMQSLGFAYALEPALRRIHGEGPELRRATERHLDFFNTHPFLAAAILGAVIRMEQEGAGPEELRRFKRALMGPCGAMGDSFFWGAVKPLLVLAVFGFAVTGRSWAPWAFLGSFAAVNLGARAILFRQGLRSGAAVAGALLRWDLLGWSRRLKQGCAVLLGAGLAAALEAGPFEAWGIPGWLALAGGGILALGLAQASRQGVRAEWMVWGLVAASLFLGMMP